MPLPSLPLPVGGEQAETLGAAGGAAAFAPPLDTALSLRDGGRERGAGFPGLSPALPSVLRSLV